MRNSRAPAGFRPNGWPFGLQSRCRLGTFEPAKNLESGEVLALGNPCETAEPLQSRSRLGTFEPAESMEVSALGNPCETAQPQQDSGPMGGRLVCRADLVWAPFEPAKNLESGEVLALGNPCETAEPLQSRSRLGTFEAAESMEVSALGNPCETAQPQQDSGPMGGRLVCRADLVWAPLNPLKTWRVERYWRWATHAKQQSPSRIQAQWVAVWSAEPMSFGHL